MLSTSPSPPHWYADSDNESTPKSMTATSGWSNYTVIAHSDYEHETIALEHIGNIPPPPLELSEFDTNMNYKEIEHHNIAWFLYLERNKKIKRDKKNCDKLKEYDIGFLLDFNDISVKCYYSTLLKTRNREKDISLIKAFEFAKQSSIRSNIIDSWSRYRIKYKIITTSIQEFINSCNKFKCFLKIIDENNYFHLHLQRQLLSSIRKAIHPDFLPIIPISNGIKFKINDKLKEHISYTQAFNKKIRENKIYPISIHIRYVTNKHEILSFNKKKEEEEEEDDDDDDDDDDDIEYIQNMNNYVGDDAFYSLYDEVDDLSEVDIKTILKRNNIKYIVLKRKYQRPDGFVCDAFNKLKDEIKAKDGIYIIIDRRQIKHKHDIMYIWTVKNDIESIEHKLMEYRINSQNKFIFSNKDGIDINFNNLCGMSYFSLNCNSIHPYWYIGGCSVRYLVDDMYKLWMNYFVDVDEKGLIDSAKQGIDGDFISCDFQSFYHNVIGELLGIKTISNHANNIIINGE